MVKLKNLLGDESPVRDGSQETITGKVEHSESPYERYFTSVTDFTSPLELDGYTKAVVAHHGELQALKEAVYMKRLLESLNNKGGGSVLGGGVNTPDDVIINQVNGNGGEYLLPNMLLGKYVSLGDSPYDAVIVKVKPNGEMVLEKTYHSMNIWENDHIAREMADAFLEQKLVQDNGDISGLHSFLNLPDPEYAYRVAKTLNEKYFGEGRIKELAAKKEKLLLVEQDLKRSGASKDRIESVKKAIESIDETIISLHKGGTEGKIAKSLIDANKFSELIAQTDSIISNGYDTTLKNKGVVVNVEKYINETKKNSERLLEEYLTAKANVINRVSEYVSNPDDKAFLGSVTPSIVRDVYNKMLSGTALSDEERKVSQFMVGLSDDLSILSEVSRHKALQSSFEAIGDYLGWGNRNKTLQRGVNENDIMYLIDPEVKMSKQGKNYGVSYWHAGLKEGEHKTYSGIAIGGTFADKRDGAIESLIRGIGQGLVSTAKVGLFLTGVTGLNRVYHELGIFNTLDKLSPVSSELAERSLYNSDPYEPTWNFSWDKMMNLTGNFTVDLATSIGAGAVVKGLLLGGGRQLAKHAAKAGSRGALSGLWAERLTKLATKEVSLLKGVPIIGKYGGRLSFPTIIGAGIIDGQEVWQEGANMGVNPFINTLSTVATIGTVGVLENLVDIEGIGRHILGKKLTLADIPKKTEKSITMPKSFKDVKQAVKDIKSNTFSKTQVEALEEATSRSVFEATVHNTLTIDANQIAFAKARGINKDRLFTETVNENGILVPKTYRLDKTDEALAQTLPKGAMTISDFNKMSNGQKQFLKDGILYRKTESGAIEKIPLKEVNEYGLTADEMAEAYKLAAERAKYKFMRYGLLAPYIKIGDKLFNNNVSRFFVGSAMEGVTEVLQDISMYGIKSTANAIDLMIGLAVPEPKVEEIRDKVYKKEVLTEQEKEMFFRPGTYEAELDFDQLVEAGVAGALMGGGANIVGGIRRGLTGKTPEKDFIEKERAYKEMLAKNYGLDLSKEEDKAELDKIYANSFNLVRMVHLGLEEDYLFNLKKLVKQGFVTATQYAEQEKFINEYKIKNILYGDVFNSAWNKINYSVKSGVTPDVAKAIYMEKLRLKDNLIAKRNRLAHIQRYTTANEKSVNDFAFSLAQEKATDIEQGNILDSIIESYNNAINNIKTQAIHTANNFIANRQREVAASRSSVVSYFNQIRNEIASDTSISDIERQQRTELINILERGALAEMDIVSQESIASALLVSPALSGNYFGFSPLHISSYTGADIRFALNGKEYTLETYFSDRQDKVADNRTIRGRIGTQVYGRKGIKINLSKIISDIKENGVTDAVKGEIGQLIDRINQIQGELNTIESQNIIPVGSGFMAMLNAVRHELNTLSSVATYIRDNAESSPNELRGTLTAYEKALEGIGHVKVDKKKQRAGEGLFGFIKQKFIPVASEVAVFDKVSPSDTFFNEMRNTYKDAYTAFASAVMAEAIARKYTGQAKDFFYTGETYSKLSDELHSAYDSLYEAKKPVYNDLYDYLRELGNAYEELTKRRNKAYAKAETAIDEVINEYNEFIAPIEEMKKEVEKELSKTESFLAKGYADMVKDIDAAIEASAIDELKNIELSYLDPKQKDYYKGIVQTGLAKFIRYYFYQRNIENLNKTLKHLIERSGEYYSDSYMPLAQHQRYMIALKEIIEMTPGAKDNVMNELLRIYKNSIENNYPQTIDDIFSDIENIVSTHTDTINRLLSPHDFDGTFNADVLLQYISDYNNATEEDARNNALNGLLSTMTTMISGYSTLLFYETDNNLYIKIRDIAQALTVRFIANNILANKNINSFMYDLMFADYNGVKEGKYTQAIEETVNNIYNNVVNSYSEHAIFNYISKENVNVFVKGLLNNIKDEFLAALDKVNNPNLLNRNLSGEGANTIVLGLSDILRNNYPEWRQKAEERTDLFSFISAIYPLYKEQLPKYESFNAIANAIIRQGMDGATHEFILNEINVNDIDTIIKVLSEISILMNTSVNEAFNDINETGKTISGIINNLTDELNVLKVKATNISILKHNKSVLEIKDAIFHVLNNISSEDLNDDIKNQIKDLFNGAYYTTKFNNGVAYYEVIPDVMRDMMSLLSNVNGMQTYFDNERAYISSPILATSFGEVDNNGIKVPVQNFPYNMQQRINAFFYTYNLLKGKTNYIGGLGGTGKTTSLKLAIEVYARMITASGESHAVHFVAPNDNLLENPAYTNYTEKVSATKERLDVSQKSTYYENYFNEVIKEARDKKPKDTPVTIVIDEYALYNNEIGKAVRAIKERDSNVNFIYISDIAQMKHPSSYTMSGGANIDPGVEIISGMHSNVIWRNANYGLSKAISVLVPKIDMQEVMGQNGKTYALSVSTENKDAYIQKLANNLFHTEDNAFGAMAVSKESFFSEVEKTLNDSATAQQTTRILVSDSTEAQLLKTQYPQYANIIFSVDEVQGTEIDNVFFYTEGLSKMVNSDLFNSILYTATTRAKNKIIYSDHMFDNVAKPKNATFVTNNTISQDMSFAIEQTIALNNAIHPYTTQTTHTISPSRVTQYSKTLQNEPLSTDTKISDIGKIHNQGAIQSSVVPQAQTPITAPSIIVPPQSASAIQEIVNIQNAKANVYDLFATAFTLLDNNDMVNVC